jgi:hypothetical protein
MEPVLYHITADWRRSILLACVAGLDVLIDPIGGLQTLLASFIQF